MLVSTLSLSLSLSFSFTPSHIHTIHTNSIKSKRNKGQFRPESPVPLKDLSDNDKGDTFNPISSSSSSNTTSPRRELISPLHMSGTHYNFNYIYIYTHTYIYTVNSVFS